MWRLMCVVECDLVFVGGPVGLGFLHTKPGIETLGYCHLSLRDKGGSVTKVDAKEWASDGTQVSGATETAR